MIKKLTTIMLAAIFSFSMAAVAQAGLHWELEPTGPYGPVAIDDNVTLNINLVNDTAGTINLEGHCISFVYDTAELNWTSNYTHTQLGDLYPDMFGPPEDNGDKVDNYNNVKMPFGSGYDLSPGSTTMVGTLKFQVVAAMEWDTNVDISLYYRAGDGVNFDGVSEKIPCTVQGPDVGLAEPKPDLVISEKYETWIDPAHPSSGYTVFIKVKNQGAANAVASEACLYIDDPGHVTSVASVSVPALPAGQETDVLEFNYTVYCSDDSDTVSACADCGGVVDESVEDNNCLDNEWPCHAVGPNLVVTAKEENWQDRDTYKVLYTVMNIGTEPAGISRTRVTVDGVEMGRNLTPALGVGESIQGVFGPFPYTGPEDTIIVCADVEDDVEEMMETDNCLENQLIPDLVVTDKYEQWNKDGTYNVYYTKQNIGNAPCGDSITCVYIDGVLAQSIYNPGLQPGESIDGVFESLVCVPDSDVVKVCADCRDDIEELLETNNCMENTWDCYHRPDLIISGWSLMVDDTDPTKYQLYFTVENIGSAGVPIHQTQLMRDGSYYKHMETPALAAGESVTQIFTEIEVPVKALKLCADYNNAIEEISDDNNCTPGGFDNIWGGPGSFGPHVYVDVRNGLAVPGSTDRVVQINLDNSGTASPFPVHQITPVKGMEIEILDADNWLTIREAKACGRAEISGFTCSFSELGNGAVRVVLASPGAATIKKGIGPVITLKYRVSSSASPNTCIALDPVKVKVAREDGTNIQTLADSGTFCFTSDSWGDVYPEGTCGDGQVDIFDILEEIGFALGSDSPIPCQFVAGDVPNGTPPNCVQPDEYIDILDVLVVIEKALGINNCADGFNG